MDKRVELERMLGEINGGSTFADESPNSLDADDLNKLYGQIYQQANYILENPSEINRGGIRKLMTDFFTAEGKASYHLLAGNMEREKLDQLMDPENDDTRRVAFLLALYSKKEEIGFFKNFELARDALVDLKVITREMYGVEALADGMKLPQPQKYTVN
ncbi:hypothetical protein ACFLZX_00895 [Nanoarchaeota archaeon]